MSKLNIKPLADRVLIQPLGSTPKNSTKKPETTTTERDTISQSPVYGWGWTRWLPHIPA